MNVELTVHFPTWFYGYSILIGLILLAASWWFSFGGLRDEPGWLVELCGLASWAGLALVVIPLLLAFLQVMTERTG